MRFMVEDLEGNLLFQGDPEKAGQSITIKGPIGPQPANQPPSWNFSEFLGGIFKLVPIGLSMAMQEGVAYAAEITLPTISPIVSSASSVADKILYGLVNGINNPNIERDIAPDYIGNLETDLFEKSNLELQR